jgi:hypothetical protein
MRYRLSDDFIKACTLLGVQVAYTDGQSRNIVFIMKEFEMRLEDIESLSEKEKLWQLLLGI